MTLQELYRRSWRQLETCWPDSCRFEASQLLKLAAGVSAADLLLTGEREATPEQERQMEELIDRRCQGEPLQYLLGEWEFYGLPFVVGPGVLVPRGDTETVADTALKLLKGWKNPAIADLCSGSGAIALALHRNLPDAKLYAVELSDQALPYLRRNTESLSLADRPPVEILVGDVREMELPEPLAMIVSNPPYIAREELADLPVDVRREPVMALDGGEDGLDFYRAIVHRHLSALLPGGYLVFEVGYDQAQAVSDLLRQAGMEEVSVVCDLAGVQRCVYGRRGAR